MFLAAPCYNGTPAYKTPEEYYDEVLELRKTITETQNENATLKAKQRRLQDELSKKDKELVQTLEMVCVGYFTEQAY